MGLMMRIDNDNVIRDALLRDFPDLANDEECLSDTLAGISNFEDQASAVLSEIFTCDALLDGIDHQIDALKVRHERFNARRDRLRRLLLDAMTATNRKKMVLPSATVTVSAAPRSVIIMDQTIIPPSFMITPPAPAQKPDKAAIKKSLVGGDAVPGCTLSNAGDTITIRRG